MKQVYSRFRVMLLTFTLGLAIVPFSNALYEKWSEIPVDPPLVESDSPIVVITVSDPMPFGSGTGCGSRHFGSDGRLVKSIGKKAKDNTKKGASKSRPVISKKT